ncbi:hypothetical protein Acor_64850 [Acrocarpospora corrugata]|uniref:Nucleoside phosphorylase domain-containing protein n=1 Tax=Acrocarpospora corrugata TaxID=35763 RepID=A0A5M3W5T7_9ACTN|nr:hypothetical protein [Acrocarpospora corrugata]GES04417.1 hypothetical protein Acor_64850 [Acrocarpospora corrugata]
MILWIAGRESRLVWQDLDGFALLERPLVQRQRGGGLLVSTLRLADRRWEFLALFTIPALFLLASVAMIPFRAYLIALGLVAAGLTALVVMMAGLPIRQAYILIRGFLGYQSAEENVVGNLPFEHWWMPLCHQCVPERVDTMPDQVRMRLSRLIRGEVQDAAALLGARADRAQVTEVLVCLLDGATSPDLRAALVKATAAPASDRVALIAGSATPEESQRKFAESGGFLPLYLLGVLVAVLAESTLVPGFEQEACAPDPCRGRPDDFGSAFRWLLQRLLLSDPNGLSPLSFKAWTFGWLTSLLGLVLIPVAILSFKQFVAAQRKAKADFQRRHGVTSHTRVLILVATRREVAAVISAATKDGREAEQWHLTHHTVFKLGVISSAEVFLCRCEQGALGPGAATLATQSLIDQVRPSYVILTGIGYGLKDDHELCDIMVATQVRVMDQKRVQNGAEFVVGDRVSPSVTLGSRADAAATGWTGPDIHFGPMLAMNTLVNDKTLRDHLKTTNPDAIGGEMEAGGVYAAAAKAGVDWIAIKSICDWGVEKNDEHQAPAAKAAAEFVIRMVDQGGLNEPPSR